MRTRPFDPYAMSPKFRWMLFALLLLAGVAWYLAGALRGPVLAAYRIEAGPLVQTVVATGRVISTSRSQVGSEITGTVVERRVKEGDVVRAGDVLAVLRADDLTARLREAEAALLQLQRDTRPAAEAALRQAEVQLAQAGRERRRREDLFQRQLIAREAQEQAVESEAVARSAVEQARAAASAAAAGGSQELQLRERIAAARAQLARTQIRAQSAGVVLTRNAEPGDLVQPGRVLFEIARSGATEIEVLVDEKNLAQLAIGQSALCVADAWPDRPFPATITFIAPAIDPARGTVVVRLAVEPVPDYLRQDMTISVNVETGRRDNALAVPNDALLDAGTAVLVVRDGRLARQPVRTGLAGLAMTEVLEGLAAGDLVLADAAGVTAGEGGRVRAEVGALPAPDAAASSRRELPVQFD